MEKVREHEVNLSSALTVFRNSVFLFVYVSRSTSSCRKPNCSIVIRKYMWNLFLIPVQFYDVHLTFRVPWCSEFILFVGSYKSSYNLQFFFRIRSKRAFTIHFIQHNARVIGNIRWPYECTCTGGRLTSYCDVTKRIIRDSSVFLNGTSRFYGGYVWYGTWAHVTWQQCVGGFGSRETRLTVISRNGRDWKVQRGTAR